MSARSKGRTFETKIVGMLKGLYFTVDKARAAVKWTPKGMFSSANDFFGVADIMAFRPDKPYTLFLQLTTNHAHVAERRRKMEKIAWNLGVHRPQVWCRGGERGALRSFWLRPEGWNEYIWKAAEGIVPTCLL